MSKIVITGFMGSGKSSVAKALAQLLGCEMVDLDEAISAEEGRSAGEIITEDGEPRFRELEQQVLGKLLQTPGDQVVALGGGAWIPDTNRQLVAKHRAISVWLDAPFNLCWKRIAAAGDQRPLAPNEAVAFKLFSQRTSCYELADLRVAVTEQRPPVEIAAELAEALAPRKLI
jgi:shikimate kinase